MLASSNLPIAEVLGYFKEQGIPVGFLVPTETGLHKSIMDAHDGLRKFLKARGVHDYAKQQMGTAHKRLLPAVLLSGGKALETKVSLYRPLTKKGDPRIWVYGLAPYASDGDLLALALSRDGLAVINCSRSDLPSLLAQRVGVIATLVKSGVPGVSPVAGELLGKLSAISQRGFIKTLRSGDTGVGFTLETLLGIQANSNRAPDFKGIELKAGRRGNYGRVGQHTVFSQVPNWGLSSLKGSKQILLKRGRFSEEKQRLQLNHEISCVKPNSYNMKLELENDPSQLFQVYVWPPGEAGPAKERDVVWLMDKLIARVEEKHRETMWVNAKTLGSRANEQFWYTQVKHTTGLDSSALPTLLESGAMTVHYLIKQLPSGAAKDQGYLFKMAPKYLPVLFSQSKVYDLPWVV